MELRLDLDGYLAEVRRGVDHVLGAASGRLDHEVASCPGWDLADLVDHVGSFFCFWDGVVRRTRMDEASFDRAPRVPDDELIEWLGDVSRAGIEAMAEVGDIGAERWNWSGHDQTMGWIARRAAAEIGIHAWDATAAVGAPEAVSAEVGVDGVDEFFEVFAPLCANRFEGAAATVHLHATDADGEWLVRAAPGRIDFEHGHAKGDVAVRAPASDLFLLCWRRADPDGLETFGDLAPLRALLDAVKI